MSQLFEQAREAEENEKPQRQIFKKITTELETYIEEKVFYPALKENDELKNTVLEAYEEHRQVKTLIRDIERLSQGNERFPAKLKVLMDNVEHHVEEEEGELFPKVEDLLSEGELEVFLRVST